MVRGRWSRYDFEYDDVSGALSTKGPARCLIEVKACAVTHSPAEARFYLTANELDAMRGVQQRQTSDGGGSGLPTAFVIVLVASPLHNPQMVRLLVFHFRTTPSLYGLPTLRRRRLLARRPVHRGLHPPLGALRRRHMWASLPGHRSYCSTIRPMTLSIDRALLNAREIAFQ